MSLKGRVAIITGASRGVGRQIALDLAREGCKIVVAAKSVEENPSLPGTIYSVAKEVEDLGSEALPFQCDVRSVENINNMAKATIEKFGKIDILINNAGALWWQPLMKTPEKRFDLVVDVNVKASFFACQAVLPSMIENNWGHIINMSPPIDLEYLKNHIAYFIGKYGMTMIAHGLSEELKNYNIAVNALWPETMIESLATINWNMGTPEMWRKADILSDATIAILKKEPNTFRGKALMDEEVLKLEGINDFDRYNCVPGTNPPKINELWKMF